MFFIIFQGEKKNPKYFNVQLKEKEYNSVIFYQVKKGICFNMNQLIWLTLQR